MADFQAITPESVAAIKAEAMATMRSTLESINQQLQSLENTLLGEGWIVRNEGNVCLAYDVSNGMIFNPRIVSVTLATRFSEQDAKGIAEKTFNGNNTPAHAVHIIDALNDEKKNLEELITLIESK